MRRLLLLAILLGSPALAQHEGHPAPAKEVPPRARRAPVEREAGLPEGYAEVRLPLERRQLIGVRTAHVERATLSGEVRATGIVQVDETRERHVHSKLEGWVEELYVNAVGQEVAAGDPLYSLYSPELYAAQQEYLRSRKALPSVAVVARKRLELWDVPDDQVRLFEKRGPQKAVVFRSPTSGTVIQKEVLAGHFVGTQVPLYVIADLSRVWVVADVYEYEVNRLYQGGAARVQVQGLRSAVAMRLDYVYPTVDPVSRTVKVRLVADNPRGRLRPGTFATVWLPTQPTSALWVPREAVIDTGTRQLVYLALEGGRFRPRLIKLGRLSGERWEVLSGLSEGQQVIVSAQFLIDSESRLRGLEGPSPHEGH